MVREGGREVKTRKGKGYIEPTGNSDPTPLRPPTHAPPRRVHHHASRRKRTGKDPTSESPQRPPHLPPSAPRPQPHLPLCPQPPRPLPNTTAPEPRISRPGSAAVWNPRHARGRRRLLRVGGGVGRGVTAGSGARFTVTTWVRGRRARPGPAARSLPACRAACASDCALVGTAVQAVGIQKGSAAAVVKVGWRSGGSGRSDWPTEAGDSEYPGTRRDSRRCPGDRCCAGSALSFRDASLAWAGVRRRMARGRKGCGEVAIASSGRVPLSSQAAGWRRKDFPWRCMCNHQVQREDRERAYSMWPLGHGYTRGAFCCSLTLMRSN